MAGGLTPGSEADEISDIRASYPFSDFPPLRRPDRISLLWTWKYDGLISVSVAVYLSYLKSLTEVLADVMVRRFADTDSS